MSSDNHVELSLPDDFDNVVRLFPLPNLVLYPGVVQALHVFEPRYREMTEAALASDQLITMALIRPDWEPNEFEPPALAETVCVGKILSHTQLEDGRYNLFLVGVSRARIVTELDQGTSYRTAEVEVIRERREIESLMPLRQAIGDKFRQLVARQAQWNQDALDQFLDNDLSFGHMVDMICYSCGASPADQQRVLETIDLARRGKLVLSIISALVEAVDAAASKNEPTFPPDFSLN